ncbi:uncharacterized protein EI90DRAFT_3125774 [Cantharellus anzutake]|uniref:uncharacterized protein n=1 Tax=Cantharellus anzutake TaxID=1750568 RepID=UPI0019090210|nr:uncharacterized protein EI90DRAFT_3125774 [Cantharellus anzutake]KAF8328667.1 hypothetical protein EI90DRAFT_3125774 [Cantharellus anzutake]
MPTPSIDSGTLLKYLGLSSDHSPSPSIEPLRFLSEKYLHFLPTSKRSFRLNRRTIYALTNPPELGWEVGKVLEPSLWECPREENPSPPGKGAAEEEKSWVEEHFLESNHISSTQDINSSSRLTNKGYVGRLAGLLAEYEEERAAERARELRKERAAEAARERETEEEFDSESDEADLPPEEPLSLGQAQCSFERMLRERFIDGLLDASLYESVDYNEKWDPNTQDEEDRWFDDDGGN